jgi:hypothetical protein
MRQQLCQDFLALKKVITCLIPEELARAEDRQGEDMVAKIRELEMQFDRYTKGILKSLLSAKEIEEITKLSETSLQNVVVMQRLAKQIQEASEEG